MIKIETIIQIIIDNGGRADWNVIYNQIEHYYPNAKNSKAWQEGVRVVLYRGIKEGYIKCVSDGLFALPSNLDSIIIDSNLNLKEFQQLNPQKYIFYISFWTSFKNYLEKQTIAKYIPFLYKPSNHNWYDISFGINKYHIVLRCSTKKQLVSVDFYIIDDKSIFDSLFLKKDIVEQLFGFAFEWKRYNDKKASVISISKSLNEFDNYEQCFNWFVIKTTDVFKNFCNLIDDILIIYPETAETENCIEGAKTTVQVNKYERSSVARQKCIEINGCYCHVCGLNFEKTYGEIGKDFIHVHHKIPLNEIKEEYIVDPINDLTPVCPNCHAMLHRKINDRYLSIEGLKAIVNK